MTFQLPNREERTYNFQNEKLTKVVLVTNGSDESSWEIIRHLENSSHVRLFVIEKKPPLIQRAITRINLISTRFSIFSRKTIFYTMPEERSIDIDTKFDWKILKELI